MPKDQRPPGADVVQVLVAVPGKEKWSFAPGNEWRLAANCAKGTGRTINASRNDATGPLERVPAANADGFHGFPDPALVSSGDVSFGVILRSSASALVVIS